MAQQSASNSVPLPPGWEAKYNEQAKRYYFICHTTKITQWDDPRLTHPFIWGRPETTQLEQLKITFKDFPEMIIRESLLKTKFNLRETINELNAMKEQNGAPQSTKSAKSEVVSQSELTSTTTVPKKQPTPAHSPKPSVKQVDDFTFMSVKSKFPEVPNFIINDVLASFNQNEEKACKELGAMGYNAKKQAAVISKFERAEIDKEERAKLTEKQRNEVFNQLKREFSSFSDELIRQVLKKAKYDTVDARSAMRQLESKGKLEDFLTKINLVPQREQNEAKENSILPTAQPETSRSTLVTINSQDSRAVEIIHNDLQQKSKKRESPDANRQPSDSLVGGETSQGNRILFQGASLAKGPDSTLRHGPNKDLLTNVAPLANGPDPLLRRGPCKDLHSGPNNELLHSASFKAHSLSPIVRL